MTISEQCYAAGEALMLYDIARDRRTFRWRGEEFSVDAAAVGTFINGFDLRVAKIDDLRKIAPYRADGGCE